MRLWRTILLGAMATLWVAAGMHCRLEVLPGFEFLSCCQHSATDHSPAHHEQDCDGDGCAAIESGFYQLQSPQSAPAKPLLLLVAWVTPRPDLAPASAPRLLPTPAASPPELSRLWQFSQRAALPPRAPSFVS
jgi:hypothetical protein